MRNCAVIATHHKAGTVWLLGVFRRIARELGIGTVEVRGKSEIERYHTPAIVFDPHSNIRRLAPILRDPSVRVLHMIRDPRDVLISGMHYHRTAREAWLHQVRPEFGGLSYQQKLNSLADDFSRYEFEMHNSTAKTVVAMRRWKYNMPNSLELKYEDLIGDVEMILFTKAVDHLQFEKHEIEVCKRIFCERSLFGGTPKTGKRHIRSGRTQQWKQVFDEQLARAFANKFGTALIQLGYETNNNWAESMGLRANQKSRERLPRLVEEDP